MNSLIILCLAVLGLIVLVGFLIRDDMIQMYKIGYYEQKLKNRGVDISHVENITLKEIGRANNE